MLSKISLFSLLLALALPTVACSIQPSKAEFDKFVLKEFKTSETNRFHMVWNKNPNIDDDRTFWIVTNGPYGQKYSGHLDYLFETKITKNNDEESVKNYPYIGTVYIFYINTNDNRFMNVSGRKTAINEMRKLKMENLPEQEDKQIGEYSVMIRTLKYKWGKTTKKWQ